MTQNQNTSLQAGGAPRPPEGIGQAWDARYAGDAFFYGQEPNDFLRESEPLLVRGARVLSLAEGEGRNAVFLAERGHRVVGVDASAVGLAKAQTLAAARGVHIETVVADLSAWQWTGEPLDGVVAIWCHLPVPLRAHVLNAAIAALRPGGLLILESYTPDQVGRGTGGPPNPALLPTAALLREELRGLDVEHLVERERHVSEGAGHLGLSAVVQLRGRGR
ncbi:MAG: class I SAM-dependent methyltransferase [Myxococcales bacterium]|nr:class I SAM-dependent methyltransferase [Myxococcales bacterium]